MISATAAFGVPSTVSGPAAFELILSCVALDSRDHIPGDTTYQSGSFEASTSLSMPSVRQGRRPTKEQFGLATATPGPAMPSFDGLPIYAGCSGHGNRPGLSSPAAAACCAT